MGHSAKTGKRSLFRFKPEEFNKMGSRGSKQTIHNGYSHHSKVSLTTLKWHSKLFRTGESCQTESSSMRWRKCQGPGLQHNSASVRDRSRECSFVENLHQTQTLLPLRKCAQDLPTQFIGQRNCGAPVCVVAQQSSSVRELQAPSQTEVNQHTSDKRQTPKTDCTSNQEHCSLDSPRQKFSNSVGHVAEDSDGSKSTHEVFFSTEVPQNITIKHNKEDPQTMSNNKRQSMSRKVYIVESKKYQRALHDQIHKVVVNLEEVLLGLKEVQLEIKEVVLQIDHLTSSIDLEEDDSGEASGCCRPFERARTSEERKNVDAGIHSSGNPVNPGHVVSTVPRGARGLEERSKDQTKRETPSSVAPPVYPTALSSTNNSKLKFNCGATASQIEGATSDGSALPRSKSLLLTP